MTVTEPPAEPRVEVVSNVLMGVESPSLTLTKSDRVLLNTLVKVAVDPLARVSMYEMNPGASSAILLGMPEVAVKVEPV
jgi:hypothetical protein